MEKYNLQAAEKKDQLEQKIHQVTLALCIISEKKNRTMQYLQCVGVCVSERERVSE